MLRLLAPAIEVSCGLLNSNSTDAVDGAVERDVGLDRGCVVSSCSSGVAAMVDWMGTEGAVGLLVLHAVGCVLACRCRASFAGESVGCGFESLGVRRFRRNFCNDSGCGSCVLGISKRGAVFSTGGNCRSSSGVTRDAVSASTGLDQSGVVAVFVGVWNRCSGTVRRTGARCRWTPVKASGK